MSSKDDRVHLPVVSHQTGALRSDGSRRVLHPADVKGRFATWRKVVFAALVLIWILLPLVEIGGAPAVFLDVPQRQFHLFGTVFSARDVWLLFFVLTAVGLGIAYLTAMLGRVWCGWSCPQTVFLEGIFRPIERLVDGPGGKRQRLEQAPWGVGKVLRRVAKHALFFIAAAAVAHIFVSYFVSVEQLWEMIGQGPGAHPTVFVWALVLTGIFYFDFAFFREQVCLIICPYGRLQSVLFDDDSLVIGYDQKRGEPRGKLKSEERGDCIDCSRCVAVCPTGIDIREGLQLDCVACSACVDACDEIMDKVGQPKGLIRYDSLRGLRGEKRRFFRGRIYVYSAAVIAVIVAGAIAFSGRTALEARLVRATGAPFVVEDGYVRNSFRLRVVNKENVASTISVQAPSLDGVEFLVAEPTVELAPLEARELVVVARQRESVFEGDLPFEIVVESSVSDEKTTVRGKIVGPGR